MEKFKKGDKVRNTRTGIEGTVFIHKDNGQVTMITNDFKVKQVDIESTFELIENFTPLKKSD